MPKLHKTDRQEHKAWREKFEKWNKEHAAAVRAEFPKYEQHPFGKVVPPMSEKEFKALERNICTYGLKHEIILHEGMVLVGWEVYLACWIQGKEASFTDLPQGEDPMAFIRGKYNSWRGLNSIQRAVSAANEYLLQKDIDPPIGGRSVAQVAKSWGESERSVERILRARPLLADEVLSALEHGKVSSYWVEKVSKLLHPGQAVKLELRLASRCRNQKASPLAVLDLPQRIEISLTGAEVLATHQQMQSRGYVDAALFVQHTYLNAIGMKEL